MAEVTLELVARQIERVLVEQAGIRDDITVQMGRLDHLERIDAARQEVIDETSKVILDELRVNRRQLDRPAERAGELEKLAAAGTR